MTSCSDARIHKPSRGVTRDWVQRAKNQNTASRILGKVSAVFRVGVSVLCGVVGALGSTKTGPKL